MSAPARRELGVSAACGLIALVCLLTGAAVYPRPAGPLSPTLDQRARAYVGLVASLGVRDPDTLDADGSSAPLARPTPRVPLADIAAQARAIAAGLRAEPIIEPASNSRRQHLMTQLDAVAARAEQLSGRRISVEDELEGLFGLGGPAGGFAAEAPRPSTGALNRTSRSSSSDLRARIGGMPRANGKPCHAPPRGVRCGGVRSRPPMERLQPLSRIGQESDRSEYRLSPHD
jgi:hypothetical protein